MTSDERPTQGEWLRAARIRAGFDVAARFADAIGVAAAVLSTYERDKVRVPDETSEKIARVLGLPIIETRHGLRLWIPPDAADEDERFTLQDVPTRELMQELERRFTESEHGSRKAAGS